MSSNPKKSHTTSWVTETNTTEIFGELPAKITNNYNLSSRQHIVDSLDLLEHKKFTLNSSLSDRSRTNKSSSSTNFIKKNIEQSENFQKKLSKLLPKASQNLIQSSFENSQTSHAPHLDVEARFYKKAEKYEQKKQDLKVKLDQEEVEGCTFKPKTNLKVTSKPSTSQFTKKVDDYVQKQRKKLEAAVEKAKKEQQEKIESDPDLTLHPKVCEKSKAILAQGTYINQPAHERLYQHNKSQFKHIPDPDITEPVPQEVFFKPQINKISQNLKRDQPACVLLYQKSTEKKSAPQTPKEKLKIFSENSEKILINKFCKEFNEKIERFEGQPVNYSEFGDVLKKLGFVDDESEDTKEFCLSFWELFKKEGDCLSLENLFTGLLAVQGLIGVEGHEFLDIDDFEKVQRTFEGLYVNRKHFVLANRVDKVQYVDEECTFNPEIIRNSQNLAEKWRTAHRSTGKIEDMLVEDEKRKKEKIKKLKESLEAEQTRECTFVPKTEVLPAIYEICENDYTKMMSSVSSKTVHKGIALHSYYSVHKEKKQSEMATVKEQELSKELEECTFTPAIKNSNGGNIQNFLERMKEREGIKDKQSEPAGFFKFGKSKKFKSFSDFDAPVVKTVPKKKFARA